MAETKVTASELLNGNVRMIQGGSDTDWSAPGTTNWEVTTTDIMLQEGVIASASSGSITVVFPIAFDNIPRVQMTLNSSVAGTSLRKIEETKTGFTAISERPLLSIGILGFTGVVGATITWSAKGRRPTS